MATHYVPSANLQQVLNNFKELKVINNETVSGAIHAADGISHLSDAPLAQHRDLIGRCFSAESIEEVCDIVILSFSDSARYSNDFKKMVQHLHSSNWKL